MAGDRLATIICSMGAANMGWYQVAGTKGNIMVNPAFDYEQELQYEVKIGDNKSKKAFTKRDQFAPELLYFSDCILKDRSPEPSSEDGMQDVRIVQALYKSAEIGRAVRIPPFRDNKQPDSKQRIRRPGLEKPKLVKATSAHKE